MIFTMIVQISDSSTLTDREYIAEKQAEIMRIIEISKQQEKINQDEYASLMLFQADTIDELKDWYRELIVTLAQKEFDEIQDRIVKGAMMIEKETDPHKKKQYLELYDQLCEKLEDLRGDINAEKT